MRLLSDHIQFSQYFNQKKENTVTCFNNNSKNWIGQTHSRNSGSVPPMRADVSILTWQVFLLPWEDGRQSPHLLPWQRVRQHTQGPRAPRPRRRLCVSQPLNTASGSRRQDMKLIYMLRLKRRTLVNIKTQ